MERSNACYGYVANSLCKRSPFLAAALCLLFLGAPSTVAASTYVVQHQFDGTNGFFPVGVVVDGAGNEYGLAGGGGTSFCPDRDETGCGVLYKIDKAGKFSTLFTFDGTNGSVALQKLIIRKTKLYGTTETGGAFGQGVVFSIDTDGTNFQLLHSFNGLDGNGPSGSIAMDANGNLFGTTRTGGPGYNPQANDYGYGVLYEITADGTFSQLYNFTGASDGAEPAGVVLGRPLCIYGTTLSEQAVGSTVIAGTVFKFSPGTATFTTIQSFPANGNRMPYLVGVGQAGVVYGYQSSIQALSGFYGTIFELLPRKTGYTYEVLHTFSGTGPDGAFPTGLTMTAPGQMVGVTQLGTFSKKPRPLGTIFSYKSGVFTNLYNFGRPGLGKYPDASPTVTPSGAILGTTEFGSQSCAQGQYDCGVTFQYTP